jgi:hypothetical protein
MIPNDNILYGVWGGKGPFLGLSLGFKKLTISLKSTDTQFRAAGFSDSSL